jgi:Tfp pilus assembly protein PilO
LKSQSFPETVHFIRLALLLILVNAAAYVFLIVPRQDRFVQLQTEHSNLRSQMIHGEQNHRALETRLRNLQQAEKDLAYIYEKVLAPRQAGVTDIRLELEEITSSVEIMKNDFDYEYAEVPKFSLYNFRLSVPIRGSYSEIRSLINKIERSRHFFILEQVDLSTERSEEILNLNFRISTYLTDKRGVNISFFRTKAGR